MGKFSKLKNFIKDLMNIKLNLNLMVLNNCVKFKKIIIYLSSGYHLETVVGLTDRWVD